VKVAILLGSKSDREALDKSGACDVLEAVGINVYVGVVSAHRNKRLLTRWLDQNHDRFVGFIGVAGLATALPGDIAAYLNTGELRPRPVLGVPLDDYGINTVMQMAPVVPVPCFCPGPRGIKQAAIFMAIQLSIADKRLAERVQQWLKSVTPEPDLPALED
jgi:phosphoribosylaminoimidazole carboxylase PurE protein